MISSLISLIYSGCLPEDEQFSRCGLHRSPQRGPQCGPQRGPQRGLQRGPLLGGRPKRGPRLEGHPQRGPQICDVASTFWMPSIAAYNMEREKLTQGKGTCEKFFWKKNYCLRIA